MKGEGCAWRDRGRRHTRDSLSLPLLTASSRPPSSASAWKAPPQAPAAAAAATAAAASLSAVALCG